MQVQISRWGNSQGIRLPKAILELAEMGTEEEVDLTVDNGRIVISKTAVHRTLEERAAGSGGKLGPYSEFDWGEPAGREVW